MIPFARAAVLLPLLAPFALPQPKPPEAEPDRQAYVQALNVADMNARVAALEKFIAAFPDSGRVGQARSAILDALLKASPKNEKRIRAAAEAVIGKSQNPSSLNSVASKLADARVLTADAEKHAKKALASYDLKKFLAEERANAAKRKRKPEDEAVLTKRFAERRAAPLATLGRICLQQGRTAEAEKLLNESFSAVRSGAAAGGLAELAEKKGDKAAALDYAVQSRLAGKMPEGTQERLERLYRDAHSGALSGLDDLLDRRYENLYPPTIHTEAYKPGPKRSDRVVLLEVFTGAGCPPCAGADLAFDAVLERYARQDVAVLMNHEHIPRPDPLANPATIARGDAIGLQGVPTYFIDGAKTVGGGDRADAGDIWTKVRTQIEQDLEVPAGARVAITADRSGTSVAVHAAVDGIRAGEAPLKLQVALIELRQRYSGENGIRFHPMVVRAFGGPDGAGFPLDRTKGNEFDLRFDTAAIAAANKAHLDDYEVNNTRYGPIRFLEKKHEIYPGDLAIVAFVQEQKSNRVLQSTFRKVQ